MVCNILIRFPIPSEVKIISFSKCCWGLSNFCISICPSQKFDHSKNYSSPWLSIYFWWNSYSQECPRYPFFYIEPTVFWIQLELLDKFTLSSFHLSCSVNCEWAIIFAVLSFISFLSGYWTWLYQPLLFLC